MTGSEHADAADRDRSAGAPGGTGGQDRLPVVEVGRDGSIAILRLARPAAMNAVNEALRQALIGHLQRLDADPEVAAVVLTGSGPRAFCAGQDLEEAATITPDRVAAWLDSQHAMYQALRDFRKPIVAAIHGTAAGAGFQLALLCDLRVAQPAARLGQPEVRAGLASIVGSYLLSLQVGHSVNQQLSLTAELISAERAHALGIVNQLAPADQVLAEAVRVAQRLAALPRAAFTATKRRFRDTTQPGFDDACRSGVENQLACYASGEPAQIMEKFLQRRNRRVDS